MLFFVLFLRYTFSIAPDEESGSATRAPERSIANSILLIVLGVAGLYQGGQWVVAGAVGLARGWGVDDALIGLTIVAIGTSLPELVASAVAAYRKEADIAVGNVVGSNIFNILWILGVTASITPLPFAVISNVDIVMVIASTMMILLALTIGRHATITRGAGVVFILTYVIYLVYVVQRG